MRTSSALFYVLIGTLYALRVLASESLALRVLASESPGALCTIFHRYNTHGLRMLYRDASLACQLELGGRLPGGARLAAASVLERAQLSPGGSFWVQHEATVDAPGMCRMFTPATGFASRPCATDPAVHCGDECYAPSVVCELSSHTVPSAATGSPVCAGGSCTHLSPAGQVLPANFSHCGVCGQPETACAACAPRCAPTGTCDPVSDRCACAHGWGGATCNVQIAVCGNGLREQGEQCDDGNTVDGDGCSSGCLLQLLRTDAGDGFVAFHCLERQQNGLSHCCPTTVPGVACSGNGATEDACSGGACGACKPGFVGAACDRCTLEGHTRNECGNCNEPGNSRDCYGRRCDAPSDRQPLYHDVCGQCGGGAQSTDDCTACEYNAAWTAGDVAASPLVRFNDWSTALLSCRNKRRIVVYGGWSVDATRPSITSDGTVVGSPTISFPPVTVLLTQTLLLLGRDLVLSNLVFLPQSLLPSTSGCGVDTGFISADIVHRLELSGIIATLPHACRPRSSVITISIHSPVTISNSVFENYAAAPGVYFIDIVMVGGGLLTLTNNVFRNFSTGAIRVRGFGSVLMTGNVFEDSGGDLVAMTPLVFLQMDPGVVAPLAANFIIAGNNVTNSQPGLLSPLFFIDNPPFPYDGVTNNHFDNTSAVGFVFSSLVSAPLVFGSTDLPMGALRRIAVQNANARAIYSEIVLGSPAVAVCNNLCPVGPITSNPYLVTSSSSNVITTEFFQASLVSLDTYTLRVTFQSDRSDVHPVVSFVDTTGSAAALRMLDTCASVPATRSAFSAPPGMPPYESWPTVCSAGFVDAVEGWTIVNTTATAFGANFAWVVERTFTLTQLVLDCMTYSDPTTVGAPTPTVTPTLVGLTPVYQFAVTGALYVCNDQGSEAADAYAYHKSTTGVQLTLTTTGSVITSFSASAVHFHGRVLRTFFDSATSQLHVIFVTYISHVDNQADTTYLSSAGGTSAAPASTLTEIGAPVGWSVAQVGAGAGVTWPGGVPCTGLNPDALTVCEQLWEASTTNAENTQVFDIKLDLQFQIVFRGSFRVDVPYYELAVFVDMLRSDTQALRVIIPTSTSLFLDHALTVPAAATEPLIDGEKVRVLVQAGAANVRIEIESAEVCCASAAGHIVPYDPLNPDVTGCATLGAGIGDNRFVVFDRANNAPYTASYESASYTLLSMTPAQQGFEFSVRLFTLSAGSSTECALQVWHRTYDTINPLGETEIPRPLAATVMYRSTSQRGRQRLALLRSGHVGSFAHANDSAVCRERARHVACAADAHTSSVHARILHEHDPVRYAETLDARGHNVSATAHRAFHRRRADAAARATAKLHQYTDARVMRIACPNGTMPVHRNASAAASTGPRLFAYSCGGSSARRKAEARGPPRADTPMLHPEDHDLDKNLERNYRTAIACLAAIVVVLLIVICCKRCKKKDGPVSQKDSKYSK